MIQFFRKNDPYRLIWIFLILVAIRSVWAILGLPLSFPNLKWMVLGERLGDGWVMYNEVFDYTGPLSAMVYKWLNIIFGAGRWVHVVFSTILVIIQASILNSILLKNKAYDENNYLPAFLYVVLMSSTLDFFSLSPQLMSLTFIIMSLNQIFRRIDNVVTDELFLYAGIYIGLATAFFLPAIIYFGIFLLSLVIFSSAIVRRLLLFIYGFSMIFLIIGAYYFWFDGLDVFWSYFVISGLIKPTLFYLTYGELLRVSYVLGAVLLISLTVYFTSRFTNFQQNVMRVMMFFLVAASLSLWITPEVSTADLMFFIPPGAFFLAHYLIELKRRLFKILMPTLILIALLVYPYLIQDQFDNYLIQETSIATSEENTSLMLFGDDIQQFQTYKIASPFVDEYISKKVLEGLDYYNQASHLYDILNRSQPDVIIDQWGIIPLIFDRFPMLENQYRQYSEGRYERISN